MIQRGREGTRGRGGAGEKLIERGCVRLMRAGNEKMGDGNISGTRGSREHWGENKHELAH